tara:strand:+ start:556 stop:789 length:234 start_codon:yes stop_codon:yes gene_type:complete
MPKNEEEELQELNDKIFNQVLKHMKKHEPQKVAGTLMAIAMRLYKTRLSEDGFHKMLQTIIDSEEDVESYNNKDTLH